MFIVAVARMPNLPNNDPNRHRRPPPNTFTVPFNPTAQQARAIWFKRHRTDIAATASSVSAIFLCVILDIQTWQRTNHELTILQYPFDTLKTRLQASTVKDLPAYRLFSFKGFSLTSETIACAKNIYTHEGLRAFWRGMNSSLCLRLNHLLNLVARVGNSSSYRLCYARHYHALLSVRQILDG